MSDWKPLSDTRVAMRRAAMLERARQYFSDQGLLSVDTPALSRYATSDRNIENIGVRSKPGKDSFLQTSPETYMKRLLASGYPDIYSICRVFRDGESGKRHLPEFTMVEWYRLGFELDAIIDDCVDFIATCLNLASLSENVVKRDYNDVMLEFADVDALDASTSELVELATDDARLQAELEDDRSAALDLIMSTSVAPRFEPDKLTVVRHYPAGQAALARLCPGDDRVADRFEVVVDFGLGCIFDLLEFGQRCFLRLGAQLQDGVGHLITIVPRTHMPACLPRLIDLLEKRLQAIVVFFANRIALVNVTLNAPIG